MISRFLWRTTHKLRLVLKMIYELHEVSFLLVRVRLLQFSRELLHRVGHGALRYHHRTGLAAKPG